MSTYIHASFHLVYQALHAAVTQFAVSFMSIHSIAIILREWKHWIR